MLTQERLKELLDYDPETGVFVWKVGKGSRAQAGQRAGCGDGKGYTQIKIDKKLYLAHRLVWFYAHGRWPKEEIDHINRVKNDNRIDNLREVTHQQQQFNKGAKGYYWSKWAKKWMARIKLNGKMKYIGYYDTEEEASAAYLAAKKELHIIGEQQ